MTDPVAAPVAAAPAEGIKDSLEVVNLIVAIAQAVKQAGQDGKIDLNDAPLLLSVFEKIGPAVDGISNIPAELKDIDADEVRQLAVAALSAVDGLSGKAEVYATEGINIVSSVLKILKA